MEKICVAVRVRPPVSQETSNGTYWKVEDNRITLHKALGTPISGVCYGFDHVFDQDCTNSMVYDVLTNHIIDAAVEGFNGTAFAYGQTSSGKTFTMNGSNNDPGIIQRAVHDIFSKIQMTTEREFLIRVSYMEIYNEEINDLFTVENQKLQIHESLERGVFVAGLREEIVSSAGQVLKLIEMGEDNRHFGETNMNIRSSRSHTIFRMVIESKGKDTSFHDNTNSDDAIRVSVLNLVDLAGSERIAKTGAGGVRLKEGKHINKSLMILGNVINKLSDGARQRSHIPYRDSKLTRILQPALGGNAKTSIICTVAPEEVHIEETKGTLQFASRAKRITNCVQVNEILTDAALLKRQKLEIEELQRKLQGSHAEVLEQEILKLRNDMLKYELEHDKLSMELEEERKSQRERDQWIREQQMKIDNLSSLVSFSGSDKHSSLGENLARKNLQEESNASQRMCLADAFNTPCLKASPSAFVFKRSHVSRQPACSPLPDTFSNIADEDMWQKMNKGYIADLDTLHMTPARKVQSFPSRDGTTGCAIEDEHYKQEIQNLRRQLELAVEERDGLKRHLEEQTQLNSQFIEEISELQQQVQLIQEIPRTVCDSVTSCRDMYKDFFSKVESFIADEKSQITQFISCTSEIGVYLFSTLEAQFSMNTEDSRISTEKNSPSQEQYGILCERLNGIITSLVLSRRPGFIDEDMQNVSNSCKYKGCTLGEEIAFWKEEFLNKINTVKKKYNSVEKKLDINVQLLKDSEKKYYNLEKEFHELKEEKDALLQKVSSSSQKLALITDQKAKVSHDLNTEIRKRKDLEDEIKKFSIAFSCRQKSLVSLHKECKSKLENLKVQTPVLGSKSLGSEN